PIRGTRAVTIGRESSALRRQRSSSAVIPVTHVRVNVPDTAASNRIDSRRLRAMTGSMTLSSRFPAEPPKATAASLPTTWAQTWQTASAATGFTFPGMIDDPGWRSGRRISASPVRGPDDSHRMSLAILYSETAMVRTAPDASTSASRAPWASKWFLASRRSVRPGLRSFSSSMTDGAKSGGAGIDGLQPLDAVADLGRPPAELLAERHRRGVHQVGPARFHDPGELGGLGLERLGQRRQRRHQLLLAGGVGAEVDGGREHVVGTLRGVDVVVGVDPLRPPGLAQ